MRASAVTSDDLAVALGGTTPSSPTQFARIAEASSGTVFRALSRRWGCAAPVRRRRRADADQRAADLRHAAQRRRVREVWRHRPGSPPVAEPCPRDYDEGDCREVRRSCRYGRRLSTAPAGRAAGTACDIRGRRPGTRRRWPGSARRPRDSGHGGVARRYLLLELDQMQPVAGGRTCARCIWSSLADLLSLTEVLACWARLARMEATSPHTPRRATSFCSAIMRGCRRPSRRASSPSTPGSPASVSHKALSRGVTRLISKLRPPPTRGPPAPGRGPPRPSRVRDRGSAFFGQR